MSDQHSSCKVSPEKLADPAGDASRVGSETWVNGVATFMVPLDVPPDASRAEKLDAAVERFGDEFLFQFDGATVSFESSDEGADSGDGSDGSYRPENTPDRQGGEESGPNVGSSPDLHRAVVRGLRSAIGDHGPITSDLIGSAAKRILGQIRHERKHVDHEPDSGGSEIRDARCEAEKAEATIPAELIDQAATVPSEDTCPYCGTDQCESIDHWTAQTDYWWRVSEEWRERSEKAEARGAAAEKARWEARIEAEAKERDLTRRSSTVDATRQAEGHAAAVLRSLLNEGADQ